MGVVNSKVFKSGNSVAVRLPKEIAFAADTAVTIERNGDVLTIRPTHSATDHRREFEQLLIDLRAIGLPDDGVQAREPFEFPERPGL